ncbi:hypothetical protein GJ496_000964 [Pomphorhynchus laevis]|nr:hypothetical protein GJ496_000964 [Pomphorhynchus laevis]
MDRRELLRIWIIIYRTSHGLKFKLRRHGFRFFVESVYGKDITEWLEANYPGQKEVIFTELIRLGYLKCVSDQDSKDNKIYLNELYAPGPNAKTDSIQDEPDWIQDISESVSSSNLAYYQQQSKLICKRLQVVPSHQVDIYAGVNKSFKSAYKYSSAGSEQIAIRYYEHLKQQLLTKYESKLVSKEAINLLHLCFEKLVDLKAADLHQQEHRELKVKCTANHDGLINTLSTYPSCLCLTKRLAMHGMLKRKRNPKIRIFTKDDFKKYSDWHKFENTIDFTQYDILCIEHCLEYNNLCSICDRFPNLIIIHNFSCKQIKSVLRSSLNNHIMSCDEFIQDVDFSIFIDPPKQKACCMVIKANINRIDLIYLRHACKSFWILLYEAKSLTKDNLIQLCFQAETGASTKTPLLSFSPFIEIDISLSTEKPLYSETSAAEYINDLRDFNQEFSYEVKQNVQYTKNYLIDIDLNRINLSKYNRFRAGSPYSNCECFQASVDRKSYPLEQFYNDPYLHQRIWLQSCMYCENVMGKRKITPFIWKLRKINFYKFDLNGCHDCMLSQLMTKQNPIIFGDTCILCKKKFIEENFKGHKITLAHNDRCLVINFIESNDDNSSILH